MSDQTLPEKPYATKVSIRVDIGPCNCQFMWDAPSMTLAWKSAQVLMRAIAKDAPGAAVSNGDHICPIHNVQMRRHESHGDVWYSHKAPDGSWCRGQA